MLESFPCPIRDFSAEPLVTLLGERRTSLSLIVASSFDCSRDHGSFAADVIVIGKKHSSLAVVHDNLQISTSYSSTTLRMFLCLFSLYSKEMLEKPGPEKYSLLLRLYNLCKLCFESGLP